VGVVSAIVKLLSTMAQKSVVGGISAALVWCFVSLPDFNIQYTVSYSLYYKQALHPSCAMMMMQGDRHSIAYFANCTGSTVLQGPQKKYPPITFPEILAEKRRQVGDVNRDEMTDEEKMAFDLNNALGPEMQPVDMTHSGKPEFEVVESCESGKPKIQPMVKGKLSPDLEHLRLQPSVSVI